MSYPSLLPAFHAQSHFQVFPSAPPQPGVPLLPRSSPSTVPPPGPSSFKAPAHKHAHHLHSIPPREKSTRTLIIDHMLWVHARTRFHQARAELGMTDRTGGASSPNFRFRERPEQYDEEDELSSDGEDIDQLKARGAGHGDHHEDEDTRMQKQDFALARCLRLRAIALEKVVSSMLDQPPPLHPVPPLSDELQSPPGSPKRREPQSPSKSHPHTLPNGVRLRLALGTVINDLFARQAPVAPYRHHHHPPPIVVSDSLSGKGSGESLSPNGSPVPQTMSPHPSTSTSQSCGGLGGVLPPSLVALASISEAPGTKPSMFPSTMPVSGIQAQRIIQPGTQVMWSDRVRTLYMEGADPSTANSPPALRCPRHLHTGCEICVEAKQPVKAPGGPAKGRNNNAWGGETTSRPPQIGSGKSMGGSSGGITGWQDGGGIGSGLANPGVHGSVLRRKSKWLQQDADDAGYAGSGAGNTRLSELIIRFLRLSALVAMELGRELGDDEYERDSRGSTRGPSASPQLSVQARKALSDGGASPLRPSRHWYMLLAGLLTRAALEGYLTGGWRGPAAASCLLSVGLGMLDDPPQSDEDEGDLIFEWFDPDDLPALKEAALIMFPSLNGTSPRKEDAEAEFEAEMKERLRMFYAIPTLTPDLSTHMEDLAWHYPAEPVERAAVRFCEAVAKWRGKPELETYKKRSKDPSTPAMTIESLVHSNPTSPTTGGFSTQPSLTKSKRPPIEHYFILPPVTGHKRRRSADDGDRFAKRVHEGLVPHV